MSIKLLFAGLLVGTILSLGSGIDHTQAYVQTSSTELSNDQNIIWSIQLQQEGQSRDRVLKPAELVVAMILIFSVVLLLGRIAGGGSSNTSVGDEQFRGNAPPNVQRYRRRGEPITYEDREAEWHEVE